ncbi:MAG: GspH/FimT family pseudopilin [Acidobacteriota bacterium]|jgi:prepilin peptidase dependent protein A
MRHAKGFGLIELLVVLGLAGIAAGGAVPGVHRIQQEWALWTGTHMLESSLLWARTHAISANDSLLLIVDHDGRGFCWKDPDGTRYDISVRSLPIGVCIVQSPKHPLRFYQHGNTAPAGTFVLQNEAGRYRVIVSVLGRVRVVRDK